jgi:phosphoglucomutase
LESKYIPTGEVTGDFELMTAPGLGKLKPAIVPTKPIDGQMSGTSGLRKKT